MLVCRKVFKMVFFCVFFPVKLEFSGGLFKGMVSFRVQTSPRNPQKNPKVQGKPGKPARIYIYIFEQLK